MVQGVPIGGRSSEGRPRMTFMKNGEQPRRIRNISELAQLAGVSAGTVSRALAGKDLVNRQTRERIQALAREYGFRPNQMASRLRTGQTGVIGLVIPPGSDRTQILSDPLSMALLGHLADAVTERGYDVMLNRTPSEESDWLERIVDSGMLEGVLLIGQSDQRDTIEQVAGDYRPLVVWGTPGARQQHCVVGTDAFAAGKLAADHLLARGATRLALIGATSAAEDEQRIAGATEALRASGRGSAVDVVPADAIDMIHADVDGLLATSDMIAMAALRTLHERGRKVPDDVAVVGFGDLPIAAQTVPQLTTVHHELAAGARVMVDLLFRRMAGEDTASVMLEPRLVVRESA